MEILGKNFKKLISQKEIESDIKKCALEIYADYWNKEDIVLLCVMNGALMFTSQLMKDLDIPLQLASIKISSYEGTKKGLFKITSPLTIDPVDKNIIICEDVVDSGQTIDELREWLFESGAKSVRTACMLYKPDALKTNYEPEYFARTIGNEFIIGYGLDYNEYGRNNNDILVLDEELQKK